MGFSAVAIADRVGHESIDITYRYAHLFPTKQTEMADKLNQEARDRCNRWRSVTVSFRMSPEENELLHHLAQLSGMTKQDYIIARLLQKEIAVHGNPRVYKALRERMVAIQNELRRIETGQSPSLETLEEIDMMANMMKGLKDND